MDNKTLTVTENETTNNEIMVTIICVTYNQEQYISDALESFVNQKTNFKFQAFVGEDCSTDSTADIVLEYAKRYPDIIVPFIRKKNMGCLQNFYDLISRINTPFVTFCDGDDYFSNENKLQIQYDYLCENPELRGCTAKVLWDIPDDNELLRYYRKNDAGQVIYPDAIPGMRLPKAPFGVARLISPFAFALTIFLRWDYSVEIPDWVWYGREGIQPIMLLQMGAEGKMGFIPEVVGVRRWNEGGVYSQESIDKTLLNNRLDAINICMGFLDYCSKKFISYPYSHIVNEIKNHARLYLDAAKRVAADDETMYQQYVIKLFNDYPMAPMATKFLMDYYMMRAADSERMTAHFSWNGFLLVARVPAFMKFISPIVKFFTKYFDGYFRGINKKNPFKSGIKNLLRLPYTVFFDRKTPITVKESIQTGAYKARLDEHKGYTWKKLLNSADGKKIVLIGHNFVGFKDFVDWYVKKFNIENELIMISLDKRFVGKVHKGLIIQGEDFLAETSPDECVFMITSYHRVYVYYIIAVLARFNIHKYFIYTDIIRSEPRFWISSQAYLLKRHVYKWFWNDGLMKTVILFKAKYLARLLRIPKFYKPYAEIKDYKDIHKGKRCFILANGPSLTMEDIDKLHGEITFGVNRLYSLFEYTEWRPTYYAMVDHLYPYPEAVRYFKSKSLEYVPFSDFCTETLFLTDDLMTKLKDNPSMEKVKFVPVNRQDRYVEVEANKFGFCGDIFKGGHDNNTVVNYCVALAYYMGIREIYLLGADCDYATPKPYFDGSKTYDQGDAIDNEELPVLDLARATMYQSRLFRSYRFMKTQFEKYGFVIYNATRGGKLEIFERKNLEEILLEEK